MNELTVAVDFASNWEIRGGVWRYGIELSRALVGILGSEHVVLPVYDRLPEPRLSELFDIDAKVSAPWHATFFDRLDAMRRRNGRFVPWQSILSIAYGTKVRTGLFRSALGSANVYHAVMTCRGRPTHGATVSTIHDLIPLDVASGSSITTDTMLEWIADHRRWADLIIVPSAVVRDELIRLVGLPVEKLRVVHHGIDPIRFAPSDASGEPVLARFGVRSGGYLLYVGTLERRKNIDRMVAGFLAAVGDRRDCPLVLVGARSDEGAVLKAALADGTGRVRYLGYVNDDDLPDLYRHARGLVHVALVEGFGFTPLEALSCGCPLVVSRHATTAEVVGDHGILVDPLDVADIAHGIGEILDNAPRCAALKARGPLHARQYTWERCARQTLDVYMEARSMWRAAS